MLRFKTLPFTIQYHPKVNQQEHHDNTYYIFEMIRTLKVGASNHYLLSPTFLRLYVFLVGKSATYASLSISAPEVLVLFLV